MKIKLKLFAAHKELIGKSELDLELPERSTISELMKILIKRYPALDKVIDQTFFAINRKHAKLTDKIHGNDEIAMFPPVSGG